MRERAAVQRSARSEAWREAAERLGGSFHPGKRSAGDSVVVYREPWRLTLDRYVVSNGSTTVTYTRVRAYFAGYRELRITVRRRNVFDRIFEAMGFGTRPPLPRELNERYVVRGKPPGRVPSLFSSGLTHAILGVPSLRLEVKRPSRRSRRRYGEDAGVVFCQTTGVISDVDRLVGMVRVVEEALDGLARVGEADRSSPTGAGGEAPPPGEVP